MAAAKPTVVRRVFLSSTARDLGPHREAVYKAISGLDGFQCVRMEDFGARDWEADALCRARVAECDVFLGLIGHLYGSSPEGSDSSFTEREYGAAVEAGVPRLLFFASENLPVPDSVREPDNRSKRQRRFRDRLSKKRTVAFFDLPAQLAAEVVTALRNLEREGMGDSGATSSSVTTGRVQGSGAAAVGQGALAVGAGGVVVLGNIHGNLVVRGRPERRPAARPGALRAAFLTGPSWDEGLLSLLGIDLETATQSDPPIRPEIVDGIQAKLREDAHGGALSSSFMFQDAHEKAEIDLAPITDVAGRYAYLDLSAVSKNSWNGVWEPKAIKILRDTVQELGRSILVSCSSVNVLAYVALKGFAEHLIDIQIDPEDASGREQAITIIGNPTFDFVVCADAPLFLDPHRNIKSYLKLFEIYRENQFVLCKRGRAITAMPTAYVYQRSSAQQQFLLSRADKDKFPLPAELKEVPLDDMADFTDVPKVMKPGDLLPAWGSLGQKFLKNPTLKKIQFTDFNLTISLFRHPDWYHWPKALDALFDLFVAEWNHCAKHTDLALERLRSDLPFIKSFARGGGFNTKFED